MPTKTLFFSSIMSRDVIFQAAFIFKLQYLFRFVVLHFIKIENPFCLYFVYFISYEGKRYIYFSQINMPSGLRVVFKIQRRANGIDFANVYLTIPAIYYKSTAGLCGSYDGNSFNDLTDQNGKQYSKQYPVNMEFVNSWK